jgi:hypothetical protein
MGNRSKRPSGNGHPRKHPEGMKAIPVVPEAEPTPEPQRVERENSVRVRFIGDRVSIRTKRACGHTQTYNLIQASDMTVTFGSVLFTEGDQVRFIEDCAECELINIQRQQAFEQAARETWEKAQKDQAEAAAKAEGALAKVPAQKVEEAAQEQDAPENQAPEASSATTEETPEE